MRRLHQIYKITLSVHLCLCGLMGVAQYSEFPDTAIVNKYHIKQIKIYRYHVDSSEHIEGKGNLQFTYSFNNKGNLIREKQINVRYFYYYDNFNQLIAMQDKW